MVCGAGDDSAGSVLGPLFSVLSLLSSVVRAGKGITPFGLWTVRGFAAMVCGLSPHPHRRFPPPFPRTSHEQNVFRQTR